jgi:acetate kinase
VNVFVLNAGSSSVKAAYFESRGGAPFTPEPDWSAEIRWSELPSRAQLNWTAAARSGSTTTTIDEHGGAAAALLSAATQTFGIAPDFIGHRIVHGLSESRCTIVDARVRALIEEAVELAPLHNRAALAGIDAAHDAFPAAPQAADFDTAFHTTMAPQAAAYALPYTWFTERGIRRYGFHGISHRYCARRTAELLGRDRFGLRLVSAHLGNGASLAAVVDGKSVDTTMGFTPLDGLMMGSRSGSVDPGLLLHLIERGTYSAAELDAILNTKSGLRGVSQESGDVRDVIAAAGRGSVPAVLALDMYVHRLCGAIAAMAAAAGGIDALAFTGGVGENAALIRERTCAGLAFLGVTLDETADAGDGDRVISAAHSAVRVVVVRAREEFAIARDIELLAAREPRLRSAR